MRLSVNMLACPCGTQQVSAQLLHLPLPSAQLHGGVSTGVAAGKHSIGLAGVSKYFHRGSINWNTQPQAAIVQRNWHGTLRPNQHLRCGPIFVSTSANGQYDWGSRPTLITASNPYRSLLR
jgi:hypothetical protein